MTVLVSVLYYLFFSWLFDTPLEHELKLSTRRLQKHVEELQGRYDTLEAVMQNLQQRDSAVFGMIFEATPYTVSPISSDFDGPYADEDISTLGTIFTERMTLLKEKVAKQDSIVDKIVWRFVTNSAEINRIPSIQPVNNPTLRLLATSFGSRVNPFYKSRTMHNGVDYTVPIGTAVFATADGVVSRVEMGGTTTGTSVTIDHGDGYETFYAFLSRSSVRVGMRIRRGDIIAFSGDNGLSYAPHLHYEVRKNGRPVNPLDYMFLEIGPKNINEFKEIASHAMQAFD